GYIASRLIPQLLDRGYQIRALARQPQRLKNRSWFHQVEITQGDVTIPSTLAPALEGVSTAYYLIHNMASGQGYTGRELDAARNFARAAKDAGVQHIIYLGGLADEEQHIAPHMRSRIETGATLRQGKVPVTEFRAGVIAGSGSISFEMIRFMTELLPIIPGPNWLKNKTQPIAIQNVMDYLLAALDNHSGHGQVFEIGGPQVTTYQELMLLYAKARGHKRRFLLLPYVPVWFMAFGIGLTTPVPRLIAYALVGGLSSDSVVLHNAARRIYPEVNLIDFESAAKEALACLHPHKIERVWDDEGRTRTLKHEGFFIYQRELKVAAAPEKIFSVITKLADRFEVEYVEADHLFLAHLKIKTHGEGWLEWRAGHAVNVTTITQTVFFTPRGFGGFFLWYLLYPIIALAFQGLLKNIARNSVVK
ncbi:MAG: NAD(P)H-binding protein, partial [Chloroflexi bacterium]|nr:NAD(P)H-binding protein [Chloroflexota bacterium]